MESIIIIILIGCLIVAIFDAIGSVLSRVLKFKYAWLTIGSVLIYGSIALAAARYNGLITGVISSGIVGAFDATIGLIISKKLNANISEMDMKKFNITPEGILMVGFFASVVGLGAIMLFSVWSEIDET